MAAAYAHLTVVNHAQKLARTALRSAEVKHALAMNLRYLELGAVSTTTRCRGHAAVLQPIGDLDRELLRLAAADAPDLLQPFEPYTVRVLRHDQGVVLLACQPDGGAALLEDAFCTAKLDRHHWRDNPGASCEFTLKMVCAP